MRADGDGLREWWLWLGLIIVIVLIVVFLAWISGDPTLQRNYPVT